MHLQLNKIYHDFFIRAKNEPVLILQGSKGSGKTAHALLSFGVELFGGTGKKFQCLSESPKQQNFGLVSDFEKYFNPLIPKLDNNGTQKTYRYGKGEMAFINIPNNVRADKIANSLGSCHSRLIDECNMFSKSTIDILRIKNAEKTILTYNPWKKFWVDDLVTDTNFIRTTWRDNEKFLSKTQIDLFLEWTELGQKSEVGSYPYWRWQVMCEGNYAELTGEIFTTENIHFIPEKPDGLHHFMIFADPSNAKGGDYFALTLTAIGTDGNCYLVDSFSANRIEKVLIAEKIRQWQKDYTVDITYIETNGEYGLKFYNDCRAAGIPVSSWMSRQDKFERIMANFDVITKKVLIIDNPQNREFIQQVYTFKIDCANDDNIDCLNNAIMAYILKYKILRVLF